MKRVLLIALITSGTGCLHVQPVGPLAATLGMPANPPPPGTKVEPPTPDPIIREAPKPTPPALYVTPGEVSGTNADEAMKRLTQEMETDRRSMEAMPRYSDFTRR